MDNVAGLAQCILRVPVVLTARDSSDGGASCPACVGRPLPEIQSMLFVLALAGVVAASLSSYANVARRRRWDVPPAVRYGRYAAWLVFLGAAYGVARQLGFMSH
jgi:hypothetical protein